MYYKCCSCGEEKYVDGCLPSVSCGMLLGVDMGVALGVGLPVTQRLFTHIGWWAWLAFVPLIIVLFLTVMLVPQFIEWLIAMVTACPQCHKRRWSWPFTRGFGL
ncbi:hypothetical protein EON83_22975 [bacterium]|nr:MAG: hypothetical protein EON83_22975 [bacterium]